MDEKNDRDALPATAWHPLFALAVSYFTPQDRKTSSEVALSRLPLRIDLLVVKRENVRPVMAHKFRSIFDYVRNHTIIEYKGVTDDLEAADVFTLLAYACIYMRENQVYEPNEMCLMVVADRISPVFVEQIVRLGGELESLGNGLLKGRLAGLPLHIVELREAYKAGPSELLLYMFTRAFLNDYQPLMGLDREEVAVYRFICEHIHQLRLNRATTHMKDILIAEETYEEALQALINIGTLKQRVAGIPPEKLLECVPPEQVIACIPVAQRLAGLAPEQRLAGLAPEQRLAGLAPEQRLAGLSAEEVLLSLPNEVLRGLSSDYINTLSPETRAAIRARIG